MNFTRRLNREYFFSNHNLLAYYWYGSHGKIQNELSVACWAHRNMGCEYHYTCRNFQSYTWYLSCFNHISQCQTGECFAKGLTFQRHSEPSPIHQTSSVEAFHSLVNRFVPNNEAFGHLAVMSR